MKIRFSNNALTYVLIGSEDARAKMQESGIKTSLAPTSTAKKLCGLRALAAGMKSEKSKDARTFLRSRRKPRSFAPKT